MPQSARDEELARARASYAERDADAAAQWLWSPLNPAAVSVRQQREAALLRLFARAGLTEPADWHVADFGCGGGEFLGWLARLGVRPEHLFGVDLSAERIAAARLHLPAATFVEAPADDTGLADASQDVVTQLTLLSSVHDTEVRAAIAAEMDRVLRPGGRVVWFDVRPPGAPLRAVVFLRRLAWWLLRGLWRGRPFPRDDGALVRFSLDDIRRLFPGYDVLADPACVARDVVEVRGRFGVFLAAKLDLIRGFRANLAAVLRKPGDGA